MTLFASVAASVSAFSRVLEQYYGLSDFETGARGSEEE